MNINSYYFIHENIKKKNYIRYLKLYKHYLVGYILRVPNHEKLIKI